MAINTTWSVSNMTHVDADGGVILAYWSLVAQSDGEGGETATEGGKARFTYDASGSGYIAYASLKESDVLGWIWEQNKEGDETAAEYKARIEAERTAKVEAQITRNATQATGVPW
jgi:hypothetical protein